LQLNNCFLIKNLAEPSNNFICFLFGVINLISNIPTLIFFPALILADIIWNIMNECFKPFSLIMAVVIGGGIGAGWAALIESFKQPRLFFLNVGSDKVVCQRPSKQLFKCTFKQPNTSDDSSVPASTSV
jgi:hypothetical protein